MVSWYGTGNDWGNIVYKEKKLFVQLQNIPNFLRSVPSSVCVRVCVMYGD